MATHIACKKSILNSAKEQHAICTKNKIDMELQYQAIAREDTEIFHP